MSASRRPRLIVSLSAGLLFASTAHAANVCTYAVKSAFGFLCPVKAGATVCTNAGGPKSNDCSPILLCSGKYFCKVELTPLSGPMPTCAFKSPKLPSDFACRAKTTVPPHAPTPTVTPVPPTPTATSGTSCPLAAGRYTITQGTGGTIKYATFASFPMPVGARLVQDVGAGDASCVHTTVVPYPGGYTVPVFCIAALGLTVEISQSGCGVGRIDSNGGSDFTIAENGDTSDGAVCGVAQASCPSGAPAPDDTGRLDIRVGNGVTDICAGAATGNAVATVPIVATIWLPFNNATCPDIDETLDPADTLVARFAQTLDMTTDTAAVRFTDLDGDGCTRSGIGPSGPVSISGACIDFSSGSMASAAAGTIFEADAPLADMLFSARFPGTLGAAAPPGGSVCSDPPAIDFGGLLSRCVK